MEGESETTESDAEQDPESDGELETEQSPESDAESDAEQKQESSGEPETELPPESEPPAETEKIPEKIQRGVHYEVTGDPGAWYRDAEDRLWIRYGTNLYISTMEAGGYSGGTGKQGITEDGALMFNLKAVNKDGVILKESEMVQEAYCVDGEVPQAEVSVSGTFENGVYYAAQSAEVSVAVAPDGKSGLKSAAYAILPSSADGALQGNPETASWTSCRNGDQLVIREEGIFQVFVRTEDQVGNLAFSQSSPICIDRKPPEVSIEGVGDQTANSGAVRIRVAVEDIHYKKDSMKIEFAGVNENKTPAVKSQEESQAGAQAEYLDIPRQREYDDVYHLSVRAEDVAGNTAEREIRFSVNRFGSVYDLGQSTKQSLQQRYLTKAEDVTFYETNIDYVGESRIFCRRDGVLEELKRGRDYQVTMQGSKDSWKQYCYLIPAEFFSKEGVYEILLSSEDAAENKSDTGMQEKKVTFVLDWTAPGCTLTGIERQIYEAEALTAYLTPYDNIELKTVRVYLDSELYMEEEAGQISDETMEIPLKASGEWQTLQVYLCDMAGNEFWTEEAPVYISRRAKQVPEYVKTRPSAREKLLDKKKGKADESQTEMEEVRTTTEKKSARMAGLSAGMESEDDGPKRGKAQGVALLALGLLMFISTVAAYVLPGFRRRRAEEKRNLKF